jgi:hypothetical protein
MLGNRKCLQTYFFSTLDYVLDREIWSRVVIVVTMNVKVFLRVQVSLLSHDCYTPFPEEAFKPGTSMEIFSVPRLPISLCLCSFI